MAASEGVDALAGRSATPPPCNPDASSCLESCSSTLPFTTDGPRSAPPDGTSYEILSIKDMIRPAAILGLIWYAFWKVTFAYYDNSPGQFAPNARFFRIFCSPLSELAPTLCDFWLIAELGGGAKQGTSICCALVSTLVMICRGCVWEQFACGPGVFKAVFIFCWGIGKYAFTLPISYYMARRGRRCWVILTLICHVTIHMVITSAQGVFYVISKRQDALVTGVLNPMLCLIAEHGSWFITEFVWHGYGREAPRLVLSNQAAFVVAAAKSLRLSCLIDALRLAPQDPSHAIKQSIASIVTMVLADVAKRTHFAYALCYCSIGCKSCFSPGRERDLLLRTRLTFGYSPIVSIVLILFYVLCPSEHEWNYSLLLEAVLLFCVTELMSGMAVLLIQSTMHNMSLRDTWQRLHSADGHLVLGLGNVTGEEQLANMDLAVEDQRFFCIPARRMGCIMVSLSVLVFTQHPIRHCWMMDHEEALNN